MLAHPFRRQRGVTLIEMVVGIAISIVIIIVVLGIFSDTVTSSQRIIERGKLDRDLSSIMDIIAADVQRAGYWSNATSSSTNPFMSGTDDLTVSTNCITLSYDSANDGTVDDSDRFGYRLTNGAIQFRPPGSTFSCTAASTNWNNLSDPNAITITAFNVTSTNVAVDIDNSTATTDTINQRSVTITLTGQLRNNTNQTQTITRTIVVRNNKYVP